MVPVGYYIIFAAVGSVGTVCTLLFFIEFGLVVPDDEEESQIA